MNDPDIRQLLIARLAKRKIFAAENVLEEVPLQNGVIRADMVYLSRSVECFEIKSHNDSLKRLITQGWQYEQSFDYVNLVCATKHLPSAVNIVPEWWGIIEVTKKGTLRSITRAQKNPNISINGMADLLTNDESRSFLKSIGYSSGVSNLPHSQLKKKIAEVSTINVLRNWLLNTLKERQSNWKPSTQAAQYKEPNLVI